MSGVGRKQPAQRFHLRSPACHRISMCGLLEPVTDEERRAWLASNVPLLPRTEHLIWLVAIPMLTAELELCLDCATHATRRAHAEAEILKQLDRTGRVK